MGQVRAKFRVMEVSRLWNGQCTVVRLLPVMAKCERFPNDTDVSEENAAFWDSTPAGEAKITFPGVDADVPYAPGQCVYIDMGPSDSGGWTLQSRTQRADQLDVTLGQDWNNQVQLAIGNRAAWASFGGTVGAPWSVVISLARG